MRMNGEAYLERLGDRDLAFLAEVSGGVRTAAEGVARLRAEPDQIPALIERPKVFDALFAPWAGSPFLVAGPFLTFSVLLAATARELERTSFVSERVGPRRRVPVFDVGDLRDFVDDPLRRVFLAELLASYTRIASGSVWVNGRRGWARRRFSELDPVRLAELAHAVQDADRPAVYRRLGDLTLFLSGVFPDYAEGRLFRPVQIERLQRLVLVPGGEGGSPGEEPGGAIGLLERLGRSSYRLASSGAADPSGGLPRVLRDLVDRFGQARRVLAVLTERYLYPRREEWFPAGGH